MAIEGVILFLILAFVLWKLIAPIDKCLESKNRKSDQDMGSAILKTDEEIVLVDTDREAFIKIRLSSDQSDNLIISVQTEFGTTVKPAGNIRVWIRSGKFLDFILLDSGCQVVWPATFSLKQ